VAAGIGVADRGHGAGFISRNVQYADAVFFGRNLGQRADADEIFKIFNTGLSHCYHLCLIHILYIHHEAHEEREDLIGDHSMRILSLNAFLRGLRVLRGEMFFNNV
ncbi:MAG: hypothetical protein Q7J84_17080, partial [Sulfuricaulis sp.]|nr:hypothetical protein [Sulfuricaulis sp.]